MLKKNILLLGSSGSIGMQTLDVIRSCPDISLQGLSVHHNIERLKQQVREFRVPMFCITSSEGRRQLSLLQKEFPTKKIYIGSKGLSKMIHDSDADTAVLAISGEKGLQPAREIVRTKKHLALATKEVIVIAGEEIMGLAQKNNVHILPIDSEHSAIWQCLRSGKKKEVKKIWLTCSGGPFRDKRKWPLSKLKHVTPSEALKHPTWNMGKKISIDSATLMNKALEVIEATHLFHIPPENIEVVLHKESLLHSAVEFIDGSIIGQMGKNDMRIPILYALSFPHRLHLPNSSFSFFGKTFHFSEVDEERFPSLQMSRKALRMNRCQEFNRSNEEAVSHFLSEKIGFLDIFSHVQLAFTKTDHSSHSQNSCFVPTTGDMGIGELS
jgi:1-deoxy-D-xylulose-5-phosphate reductoisomerase